MMVPIIQPQQQQMMQTSNLVHKHQSTKSSKKQTLQIILSNVKFNFSVHRDGVLVELTWAYFKT